MDLKLNIKRGSGLPIYLQIKEEIQRLIKEEEFLPGEKLPTERELAEALGLSRNTVSNAYKELEDEGIVITQQGRGTFVASADERADQMSEGRKERLMRLIVSCIEQAVDMGFTIDDFLAMAFVKAKEMAEFLKHMRIAVVDCSIEGVNHFVRVLNKQGDVIAEPILLERLMEGGLETLNLLKTCNLIITSNNHREDVERGLSQFSVKNEVVSVSVTPKLDTLINLARRTEGTKVGLICSTGNFAEAVRRSLYGNGVNQIDLLFITTKDEDELKEFGQDKDIILVCKDRAREIRRLFGDEKEVLEFVFILDEGSLNLLKSRLLELKRNRNI